MNEGDLGENADIHRQSVPQISGVFQDLGASEQVPNWESEAGIPAEARQAFG